MAFTNANLTAPGKKYIVKDCRQLSTAKVYVVCFYVFTRTELFGGRNAMRKGDTKCRRPPGGGHEKGTGKTEAVKKWGDHEKLKWIVDCSCHSSRGHDGLHDQELREIPDGARYRTHKSTGSKNCR